jgi:8-oxo-dGTP pyrophosphatase MutT (NUDIX family)
MEKMTNRPCLDKKLAESIIKQYCWEHGIESTDLISKVGESFIGWYSRSVAAVVFVFCKDKLGKWCVLASERGEEAADFQGMWNAPCGYLDFDETSAQCARRECFEETGVELDLKNMEFMGFEDDPMTANRQNVTFRYINTIKDKCADIISFSKVNNEGKEVGKIEWIPIDNIKYKKWAFGHDKLILAAFDKWKREHRWYRFWEGVKEFFKVLFEN